MAKHRKKRQPLQAASAGRARDTAVVAATPPEETPRQGLAAFERGDYGEAIRAWKHAGPAGARPTVARALAEAHFRRALGAGNEARRVQELHEATALAPDRAVYHFHLGLSYHRQGQLRRALAAYEAAHRLAPGDRRTRHHLALALLADPATAPRAHDLLAEGSIRDEATARLRALAALREPEPTKAVAAVAGFEDRSPLATLTLGLAQLAAGQAEAAAQTLARVRRSRARLGTEARQAAGVASVVAHVRAGELTAALDVLRALDVPVDPTPRRAFAAAARALAQELLLDERHEDALLAWERALTAEPDHAPTRDVVGQVREVLATRAARRGDFDGAARYWRAALAERPGEARILRNLALAEERLERWQEAGARWEELTRLWKKERRSGRRDEDGAESRQRLAVAYRHLASAYDAADDIHAATRTLEHALNFDPSQVDVRLRAAELYLESEEYGRAIEHLRRVLDARPDDTRVLVDLGSAYDLKGDDRQAETHLARALALEPENPAVKATLAGVYHGRGHRLVDTGRTEDALVEFRRALELDPDFPEHYECLGDAHLRLGQRAAAKEMFARGLARHPDDPKARVAVGRTYLEHGYTRDAEKLFREALRLYDAPVSRLSIGLAYFRVGELAKAQRYFKPILDGEEPLLQLVLGTLFIEAGRGREAIPYLERALALDPSSVRARLDLAWAYAHGERDYDRAEAELAEAERLARASDDQPSLAEIADARYTLDELRILPQPSGPGGLSRLLLGQLGR